MHKQSDYCFITHESTLPVLKNELENMRKQGSFHYEVFHSTILPDMSEKDVKMKETERIIVCSFEDDVLDLQAEILGLMTKMQDYDCLMPFKMYA